MNLVLDSNVLSKLCHPRAYPEVCQWFDQFVGQQVGNRVFIPELADYELRRELIRLLIKQNQGQSSLDRLDQLGRDFDFLRVTTSHFRAGARMWAEARSAGLVTASSKSLDIDVLLAAQALDVQGIVVTSNLRHFGFYGVPAKDWTEIDSPST